MNSLEELKKKLSEKINLKEQLQAGFQQIVGQIALLEELIKEAEKEVK